MSSILVHCSIFPPSKETIRKMHFCWVFLNYFHSFHFFYFGVRVIYFGSSNNQLCCMQIFSCKTGLDQRVWTVGEKLCLDLKLPSFKQPLAYSLFQFLFLFLEIKMLLIIVLDSHQRFWSSLTVTISLSLSLSLSLSSFFVIFIEFVAYLLPSICSITITISLSISSLIAIFIEYVVYLCAPIFH